MAAKLLAAAVASAGIVAGLVVADQLRDPTSWLRLRASELYDHAQELWITHTVNRLTEEA